MLPKELKKELLKFINLNFLILMREKIFILLLSIFIFSNISRILYKNEKFPEIIKENFYKHG